MEKYKRHIRITNSKFQLRHGMRNLNYLMDHIQDYFDYILKNHGEKTGYYLELLTFETIKLLGRTKSKIAKDKNGENVPY